MDDMLRSCKAVRRGAPNTYLIGDMPFMSYQKSDEQAIENAGRFIQEADCDCVKLEGGGPEACSRIRAVVGAGIAVMAHIGLTPQFIAQLGGFKAQGRTAEAAVKIMEQAKAVQDAGAWSMVLEGVPAPVGKAVTELCEIPVLGCGAGSYTDGQTVIFADMLGMFDDFTPKFVKKYANIGPEMQKAFTEYAQDVRSGAFPDDAVHSYKMPEEEIKKFEEYLKK